MSDVLTRICDDKREHIARRKSEVPLTQLTDAAGKQSPPRGFARTLERSVKATGTGLIAEIKKASPSKGLIREDFDPASLALAYEAGGAACLSVLTDIPHFQGQDSYLEEARREVNLPVLRKDFMLDPYQIVEARALGADCVLLIMAALDDGAARELEAAALALGMDVLIEVHKAAELDLALTLQSRLLGINNRDLTSLDVDIGTTEALAPHVPDDYIVVSESGLYASGDLARMNRVGVRCFLIGESLMRQTDVAAATRALLAHNDEAAAEAWHG